MTSASFLQRKSFKEKTWLVGQSSTPQPGRARQQPRLFQPAKAKGAQKTPSSESAPVPLLTQKLFRRNLWVSTHRLIEVTTETNCAVFPSWLLRSRQTLMHTELPELLSGLQSLLKGPAPSRTQVLFV